MANFLSEDGLKLYFPIEPKAVQSARFFRCGKGIRSYQPEKITDWKRCIGVLARKQIPCGHELYHDVPLRIEVDLLFSPLKSMRKSEIENIKNGGIVYKPKKPDLSDNALKGLCDALTGIVWEDDSLICEVKSRKRFGIKPGIFMNIVLL